MPIIGDRPKPSKDQLRDLKHYLRKALLDYHSWDRLTMTEREEYSAVGLKLRDRFVSFLEVLLAFSKLSWIHQYMIYQNMVMGRSQEYIAERLGLHRVTVSRNIGEAIRQMIEMIWDDESYT